MKLASFAETETTVNGVQEDKFFLIGTNWAKDINRLHKEVEKGRAEVVRESEDWLEVKVSADDFSPLTGFKTRRNLSEEQRRALGERLKQSRK